MGEYTSLSNSTPVLHHTPLLQKTALAVLSESYEVNKLALYYSRTVVLNNQRRYCNEITVMQLSERIFSEVTTSERKFTINILKMDSRPEIHWPVWQTWGFMYLNIQLRTVSIASTRKLWNKCVIIYSSYFLWTSLFFRQSGISIIIVSWISHQRSLPLWDQALPTRQCCPSWITVTVSSVCWWLYFFNAWFVCGL